MRNLAVLGSPISHSKSPALHAAAYRQLGLNWNYVAVEVKAAGLESFLSTLDESWRGLSLTMPLKREILSLVDDGDEISRIVGGANTVLRDDGRLTAFNTDVYGAERMLRESQTAPVHSAAILGGGATACSVVMALGNLGVEDIVVAARTPSAANTLVEIGNRVGSRVVVGGLNVDLSATDVVVSTIPGTATPDIRVPEEVRSRVPLIDIAYDPWPTPIATSWLAAHGGVAENGIAMLIYQALAQVRIFVGSDPNRELAGEADVLAAMRRAAITSH